MEPRVENKKPDKPDDRVETKKPEINNSGAKPAPKRWVPPSVRRREVPITRASPGKAACKARVELLRAEVVGCSHRERPC